MRILPPLLFSSFLLAPVLGAREARAQTGSPSVTGILGAVQRCEPEAPACHTSADSAGKHPHPNGIPLNTLNFEDCNADLYYELELAIANPSPSYQLEAWVGNQDCSQLANRQTSATSVCWPVAPFQAAMTTPYTLDVRLQDIVSGAFTTTHPVTYAPATDPSVCQEQTQTGSTNLTLYVFVVDAGANPVGPVQAYPITLDTRAGRVQGNISVAPGDRAAVVSIPASTDPDTQLYNVYCDDPAVAPSPASAGTSDAGASSPAGSCGSSVLVAGGTTMDPSFQYGEPLGTQHLCGSGVAGAPTIDVIGLKDDTHYSIAVAAVDSAGNVGPLSNVACSEPVAGAAGEPAGARAGCSCAIANLGNPAGMSGLGALTLASMAAMRRRRRRS
jgi:hypothetical protein